MPLAEYRGPRRGVISNCELVVGDDTSEPGRGADITLDWTNAGRRSGVGAGSPGGSLAAQVARYKVLLSSRDDRFEQTIPLSIGLLVFGRGGDDVIIGGAGSDHLEGEDGNDALAGRGADDLLYGRKGDDVIFGGDGGDALEGGRGRDVLDGGPGDDRITGGFDADRLVGGTDVTASCRSTARATSSTAGPGATRRSSTARTAFATASASSAAAPS